MGGERPEAFSEKRDIVFSPHKTAMGHSVNKGLRIFDRSFLRQVSPELPREIELPVNCQGLGNVDAPVASFRRIVQFAQRSMASARVIPRVRAFFRGALQSFENCNLQFGLTLSERPPELRS